jgi:benzoylformate decarboxylase
VVVEEALSSAPGIRQLIRSDDPQSYFGLRGGGIGWGLPAAIGVKLALPDRPVIGLIGDGSAMYTCQTLWTAAHYRIGVVFVILNNKSYRILKQRLHAMRGHAEQADTYVGMELLDRRSISSRSRARSAWRPSAPRPCTRPPISSPRGSRATARC